MLEKLGDSDELNGHHQPLSIVFIGGDEPVRNRVIQSIRLRWPVASMVSSDTGAAGLVLVKDTSPDVVLVHTNLRDMFTQVLVEELRGISTVPLLVLAPEMDEIEATAALELGADDYVLFPCGQWQLAARVWAVLRRSGFITLREQKRGFLISGRLFINPSGYEVYLDQQKVHLTPTEFRILYLLAQNHGKVVSHQVLENALWGNYETNSRSTKKHIQRLRWKLADSAVNPHWIATVYGVGYRFVGPNPRWREAFYSN